MEALIVIIALIFVVFMLVKGGRKLESRDVTSMHDQELVKYKSQFEQRAHLCIKAGNYEKYEFYKKKIEDIAAEIIRRNAGITPEKIREFGESIKKHADIVAFLTKEKGVTEKQANDAILNKIEALQNKYQKEGLNEDLALEKAGKDVYSLIK